MKTISETDIVNKLLIFTINLQTNGIILLFAKKSFFHYIFRN